MTSQNHTLILEAGKGTFDDALRQVPDVSKIAAVVISHKHTDHFGPIDVEKWQKAGIKVYGPDQMEHAEQFNIACAGMVPYSVIPLAVEHDPGILCFAFFIRANYEGKNLFFATDCYQYSRIIDALPEPLSLCLCEVNHCAHLLDTGKYPADLKERVRKTHCSVQRASLAIGRAKCTRFLLIHPSENNLVQAEALKFFRDEFPNRSFEFARSGLTMEV